MNAQGYGKKFSHLEPPRRVAPRHPRTARKMKFAITRNAIVGGLVRLVAQADPSRMSAFGFRLPIKMRFSLEESAIITRRYRVK